MFVFPFRIEKTIAPSYVWTVINDIKTVASLVYVQVSNDSVHLNSTSLYANLIYGAFVIAITFESSQRGSYVIVLPLAIGVGGPDFSEVDTLRQRLAVTFVTPPAKIIELYVAIPFSATNVQAFPEFNSKTPYLRYPDNESLNSIYWSLTGRQTITLSYEDSTVVAVFNVILIVGFLCVGVLPSSVLDWSEHATERRRTDEEERKETYFH